MKKVLSSITLLVLLLLVLPGAVMAQEPVECEMEYTVQAGDWLSKIAEKYLGDALAYSQLVELANVSADDAYTNIDNPNVIEPGWTICIPKAEGTPAAAGGPAEGPLTETALKNAAYQGIYDEAVTLTDGLYAGDPFVEGGASRPTVTYLQAAWGDLTGDGADEAVVLLAENSGGSGSFIYIAVVAAQNGQTVNTVTTLLEDRAQIDYMGIEDGQLVIKLLAHGPDDPMCCPTQKSIRKFKLDGNKLLETGNEIIETVSDTLTGVTWNWLGSIYSNDTKSEVTAPGDFTIIFNEDGSYNGKADCNNFSGLYTLEGSSIVIQPGAMTRAMCPQQELADQYLKDLGAAAIYFFSDGHLFLDMKVDAGTMEFGQ